MSANRIRPAFAAGAALVAVVCWSGASLPAASPDPPPGPTFTKDVAPILYKNCTNCHRAGEIGPMSLVTYAEVRPWAKAIAANVTTGTMPPWHADPQYGKFHNERRLSEKDIATIAAWAGRGAAQGNPADLPPVPKYNDGWTIKPDVVFEMAQDFPVPADGTVVYKYFDVPTNFTEDKWIQAVEIRPGDRAHVHHVIVYYQEPASAANPAARPRAIQLKQDPPPARPAGAAPAQPAPRPAAPTDPLDRPSHPLGLMLGTAAIGTDAAAYPEGTAFKMAAGSSLTFQMHYTTNGAAGNDRTKVGFVFAKKPPTREMRTFQLMNTGFTIPAGDGNYRVNAEATFTEDVTMWTILPHTHLRGKRFDYTVVYPDGRTETILSVPKYDFNWQTDYAYVTPLKLPKGSRLQAAAYYDNSAKNPANPDPTANVRWGDQTWEEMMFTALRYTVDSVEVPATSNASKSPGRR